MDLTRLRLETALEHQLTESSIPLMAEGLQLSGYQAILRRLYGFVRGWELWADSVENSRFRALLSHRRRSLLLVADLEHFSETLPTILYAGPRIETSALPAVLGAMYVIEGSTLGGQLISRHVERVLHLQRGLGSAYFRGYGEQTGSKWTELKDVLRAVSEEQADMLIAAAKAVFRDFRDWMSDGEPGETIHRDRNGNVSPQEYMRSS